MADYKRTASFGREMLITSLVNAGFDVTPKKTHLLATRGNEKYAIAYVTRKLSNKKIKESKPVHLLQSKLDNLQELVHGLDEEYLFCLGFAIFKYEYPRCELAVLPLSVWERSERGTIISKTIDNSGKTKFFYNFSKSNDMIQDSYVLHTEWIMHDLKVK